MSLELLAILVLGAGIAFKAGHVCEKTLFLLFGWNEVIFLSCVFAVRDLQEWGVLNHPADPSITPTQSLFFKKSFNLQRVVVFISPSRVKLPEWWKKNLKFSCKSLFWVFFLLSRCAATKSRLLQRCRNWSWTISWFRHFGNKPYICWKVLSPFTSQSFHLPSFWKYLFFSCI